MLKEKKGRIDWLRREKREELVKERKERGKTEAQTKGEEKKDT